MTEVSLIENRRHFNAVLVNTFIANLTTNFLWTAVVFWLYLETRSVLVTSFLMGGYLLLVAVMGVPFGSWVDRTRKKTVMVVAQGLTLVLFAAACGVFVLAPRSSLVTLWSAPLVVFAVLLLIGAVTESARGIALSTVVTLLVPDEGRAQANGLVGIVSGLGFAVTSVFAGLAVGLLGIEWCLLIAMALTVLSLLHLWTVSIPEPEIVHVDGAPKPVDLVGAWRAIREVPGLIWLILFGTFNNLLGGVIMALMDPYGLTLLPVEAWGILWGVLSFGFLVGGAWVARKGLGPRPLRSLLLANVAMWVICFGFTLRESVWLLALGILLYMALMPIAEAAEQTVLQRVVPLPKQGRVFGLATSAEIAAMPLSAFVVGPVAEFWLIPYMESDAGRAAFGWLLGDGDARGIALVFVLAALVGLAFTLVALASKPYRTLSAAYTAAEPPQPTESVQSEPEPEAGHSRFG